MNMVAYINRFFSAKSNYDGRLVIAFFLLLYYLILFCSSFITDYAKVWSMLGVPAGHPLFMDMHALTKAIKCPVKVDANGLNPCNTWYTYPKIWYIFSSIWVNETNVPYFTTGIILIYYYVIFSFVRKIN